MMAVGLSGTIGYAPHEDAYYIGLEFGLKKMTRIRMKRTSSKRLSS